MRPRFALSVLVLLSAAACGGGGSKVEGARVVIETRAGEHEVAVEVADTDPERQRGLMQRTSLAADAGMVFVFPSETAGGFWMKNTLVPLSIAFYVADGRIVRILDMEPCQQDPCPVYDPGVAYVGALEVNQGAFRRWNVSEGDRLRLELD
jgi:uncharacterized membrane protein (UPF0127 family)